MAIISSKNLQTINAGEGVEKRQPSYTVGGNANMEKSVKSPLKKKTGNRIAIWPSNPTAGYILSGNLN